MSDWNSIVVPYDKKKKCAIRKLVNSHGESIDIASGTIQLKCIVCSFKSYLKKPCFLASNILTHYEIDSQSKTSIEEYSPLEFLSIEGSSGDDKIYQFQNPLQLKFCDIENFEFYLLTLDKKKIDLEFFVHIYYKLCC